YYLVDVFRDRLPYPDLRREIASLAAKHNAATVLIENAGLACPCCRISGAIRRRECRAPSLASRRAASSIAWCRRPPKCRPDTLFCQSRPTGSIFFLHELLAFPNGRHDDQVDSVSQFLKWSSQRDSPFDLTTISTYVKIFVGGVEIN